MRGVQMSVATRGALPSRSPGSSNTVGAFVSSEMTICKEMSYPQRTMLVLKENEVSPWF